MWLCWDGDKIVGYCPDLSSSECSQIVLSARLWRMVVGSLLAKTFNSGSSSSLSSIQLPWQSTPATYVHKVNVTHSHKGSNHTLYCMEITTPGCCHQDIKHQMCTMSLLRKPGRMANHSTCRCEFSTAKERQGHMRVFVIHFMVKGVNQSMASCTVLTNMTKKLQWEHHVWPN